ncbi:DNA-binding transcriptional regulator, XRE-family HTH domain [Nitrosospira sp. Nl5]|uniref:helix-turn-helix transcriptional regulator n=1 Tax=Nitrosospira sp. Nl5 TaxID=200120 RepID=UPI00088A8973|nr:helix-turn-helix transcriptional regulator [Nitrosospira sp. Nl5]SCY29779.1 DNA-binding transcriptional regulator, XRE-family HTH domain [Nitrosospira sp. Nl5]
MNIAKIIREGREKLDLNQSQLAELVGVSPQAVQQWESGATQPRGKRLNRIAEVLKLPAAVMHFGAAHSGTTPEIPAATAAKPAGAASGGPSKEAGKPVSSNDPLIKQVVKAMQHMSKEDAARLVKISEALVREVPVEAPETATAVDVKPLPVPDLAPHPPPAFPPRRVPDAATKTRGKTAIR